MRPVANSGHGKLEGRQARGKLKACQTYFLTVRQTKGMANLVMKNVGKLEGVAN